MLGWRGRGGLAAGLYWKLKPPTMGALGHPLSPRLGRWEAGLTRSGRSKAAAVFSLCSGLELGICGSPNFPPPTLCLSKRGRPLESTSPHTVVSAPAFMTPTPWCAVPASIWYIRSLMGKLRLRGEGSWGLQPRPPDPKEQANPSSGSVHSPCAKLGAELGAKDTLVIGTRRCPHPLWAYLPAENP